MVRRFWGLLLLLLCLLSALTNAPSRSAQKPSGSPAALWTLDHAKLSPAEQALALTLQGLVNRDKPQLWMKTNGMNAVLLEQMRSAGTKIIEADSVWTLVKQFRRQVKGYLLYELGTPSLNVAASLCGPWNGVAVDDSLRERAEKEGLSLLKDVRGMDERQALSQYRALFRHGLVIEESVDKPGFLRDFAVAEKAFIYGTTDSAFRTEVVQAFGPEARVYGWGDDEFRFVRDVSKANGTVVAADFSLNLSALRKLPLELQSEDTASEQVSEDVRENAPPRPQRGRGGRGVRVTLKRPARPQPVTEDGVRYIAFVVSDGDNIQWTGGNFVNDTGFWASPERGKFNVTWEMAPALVEAAPRILQYFYRMATDHDGFVSGPGAPAYTYPCFQPNREKLAKQAAPFLRASELSVISVLNANEGEMSDTFPLLDLPEVQGVIYKDYAPYNRRNGALVWHNGKPCLAYKFLLWEGIQSPEQMAQGVAQMPAAPRTDPDSYALVNVHAWSYKSIGGPMEAIKQAIALLPPNTRVMTADDLITLLRVNFGKKSAAEGQATR